MTGDATVDGLSIAYLVIETMCPNVKVNVFVEVEKLKEIKRANFNYNIVQLHSAMELKQAGIKLRSPGLCHTDQFILDISNGPPECKCKAFLSQLQATKQKWLIGNPTLQIGRGNQSHQQSFATIMTCPRRARALGPL